MTPPAYRLLSLGAGIQSSTLVVLAAQGRIPTFDAAILPTPAGNPWPSTGICTG